MKGACLPMQLGISTAAFYGRLETDEAAEAISRLPLDCAEAFLQTVSEYEPAFARTMRACFGSLRCTSLHPMGLHFETAMTSASRRQRQDAFDMFRRVLDAGQALGARTYVYHGLCSARLSPLPWNWQRNLDALVPMCEEAALRGMVIGWENVFWCQLTTPERVAEAAAAFEPVRFTLDIKQAMHAGCDPLAFVRAMGSRLVNVHVCDWGADGRLCLPGEGCFDFPALMQALRGVGYQGPVILEPYLSLIASGDALLRSIAFLRDAMREPCANQREIIAPAIDERRI